VLVAKRCPGDGLYDDGTVVSGATDSPHADRADGGGAGSSRRPAEDRSGTVVKLEGARIEIAFGAQLIAEGLDDRKIIFTSKLDDKYGRADFDTNKDDGPNEASPPAATGWPLGRADGPAESDQVTWPSAAATTTNRGTFTGFNVIEIHQATRGSPTA